MTLTLAKYSHFVLIDEKNNLDFLVNESMITSALGLALCYINRIQKKDVHIQDVTYRILVIKASEDSSNQYMNFMNNVFSAEKMVRIKTSNNIQTFILEKIQVSGTVAVPNKTGIQVSGSGKK